ncbi:GNAT family N-acetyltransferase [Tissierella praeacuta]|uniref:GNAT family N-acetyltransferase n=1 Tax=Tissierella praeacuta TaxID=43131 RepID=UPI003342B47E
MIREIMAKEYDKIKSFIEYDIARNYFILLGLTSKKEVYDKVYGEFEGEVLKAVLFRRKTGTLQFFSNGNADIDAFKALISSLEYTVLIGPKSYCQSLLDKKIFSTFRNGSYISKLSRNTKVEVKLNSLYIRQINTLDLDEIVNLYSKVFSSFSSREVMEDKLKNNRGRGICIEDKGKVVSVAQTDFETADSALVVGVATEPEYQKKGLGTICLQVLIQELLEEGKDIYLQYDNLDAGRIYERLGFKQIDQMIHYEK